jgi:hypothetical protein
VEQDGVAAAAADDGEQVEIIDLVCGGTLTIHGSLKDLVRRSEWHGNEPHEAVPVRPATKRARLKAALQRLAKLVFRRR